MATALLESDVTEIDVDTDDVTVINMPDRTKFSPDEDTIESVGMEDNDVLSTNYSMKFNISNVKDEDLYQCIDCGNHMINIEWDERLNLSENKDQKKKIKDKLLTANKGKLIVDYKKIWSHGDTYDRVPTDILMILKDEDSLEKIKYDIINKLKSLGFSLKVSPISGVESLNFESVQSTSDNKSQFFKIPVKLYLKSKKTMVQGTLDCQNLFMRHFKDILVHQEMKGPLINILDKSHLASTNRVVNDV